MPTMHYISYTRFPTQKAHGLQIAQNCEAFADLGYEVELWVSTRRNDLEMNAIEDIHAHYGVEKNFAIKRVPSIDVYFLAQRNPRLEYIAFWIHIITYCMVLLWKVWRNPADIYYSRDRYALIALSLIIPKEKLAFEVHQFAPTSKGAQAQQLTTKRVGHIIAITPKLRDDFITVHGAEPSQIMVAHDGIRMARFENLPDKIQARQTIGWHEDEFIVGFMGQLHMLNNLGKGVDKLIDALAQVPNVSLALVGGPEQSVDALRERWRKHGLPEEQFLYAGQVTPDDVPHYLRAFDICAMPHPFNPQFAYYTSPLKLFEYMAVERAIVASDLPGWADVVTHGETAYLVPPDDVNALAQAIRHLKDNSDLCKKMALSARTRVIEHYTWSARAKAIQAHLERVQ